jgi:hypothetical protein
MSEATLRSRNRERQVHTVEFKVADSPTERRDAFRLVYDQYLAAGLAPPNSHRVRVTPFHLLPTTHVFVAYERGGIVATMSLVGDGVLGLPMESVYGEEVMRRRMEGLRISEVSCLADRLHDRRNFLSIFCGLSRVLAQFARRQGYHQLLVVCHPKHSAFYRRYLGFEMIGSIAQCPHVQNKPAVPLCLDFDFVDHHPPACYERFFGDWLPDRQLRPSCMGPLERSVLRRMVDRTFHCPPASFVPDCTASGDTEPIETLVGV